MTYIGIKETQSMLLFFYKVVLLQLLQRLDLQGEKLINSMSKQLMHMEQEILLQLCQR